MNISSHRTRMRRQLNSILIHVSFTVFFASPREPSQYGRREPGYETGAALFPEESVTKGRTLPTVYNFERYATCMSTLFDDVVPKLFGGHILESIFVSRNHSFPHPLVYVMCPHVTGIMRSSHYAPK